MEKLLLAIDAINPNKSALDFACFIATLTRSKVTAVFLENMIADEQPELKRLHGLAYLDWTVDETAEEFRDKRALIEHNISLFESGCRGRGIDYAIHRDRGMPSSEIIFESRYADLLIIDAETSFNRVYEGMPTEFARDILKDAECPVIIAPAEFNGIEEIVFTYDGSRSSAYAIKQFTYLLSDLSEKKCTVLRVEEDGQWVEQDKHFFKEWMKNHYSNVGYEVLAGSAENKLFDYLLKKRNVLVVMGSYSRSSLSRFFNHSKADLLIRTINMPMFIAHC